MSWKKKNHGGNPTTNKDVKRAIFIGRFQPYRIGYDQKIPCLER